MENSLLDIDNKIDNKLTSIDISLISAVLKVYLKNKTR